IVNLVDDYWNPIPTLSTPTYAAITAPLPIDQYAVLPSSKILTQQSGFYKVVFGSTVTIRTSGAANAHLLQVSDVSPTSVIASTTSAYFTVLPQAYSQLLLLTGSETLASGKPAGATPAGITGLPDTQTAGVP